MYLIIVRDIFIWIVYILVCRYLSKINKFLFGIIIEYIRSIEPIERLVYQLMKISLKNK